MMLFAAFAFLAALAFVVVFTMFTATTGTTALPPAAPAMALASMAPLEDASMVRLPMVPLELLPFTRAVSPSSALVVWLTTLTAIAVPTPTDFADSSSEVAEPALVPASLSLSALMVIFPLFPMLIAAPLI